MNNDGDGRKNKKKNKIIIINQIRRPKIKQP